MRDAKGGTDKWCPSCEKVRVVKAVDPTTLFEDRGQHRFFTDHPDIHWFRRGQICQTCGLDWTSAELPESFLDELVRLRDMVSKLKSNIEAYVEAADQAESRLADVRATMSDLDRATEARLIKINP
ncbi:hypothetical protein [Mycobacterium sp. GA-1285]|uniref:hypothetical protein n=1 Tax=Mycobacterium sp. GA-1285 TaxID=1772282 RepID=UPI000A587A1D|nr:hypothetical protein [Mycobacterium sp. GA-1285]